MTELENNGSKQHNTDRRCAAASFPLASANASSDFTPSRGDYRTQIYLRLFLLGLSIPYLQFDVAQAIISAPQSFAWLPHLIYGAYCAFNLYLVHKDRYGYQQCRLAVLVDVTMLSIWLSRDPHEVPIVLLMYILIVQGNGMRYGVRMFREALSLSFAGAATAFFVRYQGGWHSIPNTVIYMSIVVLFLILYTYQLMSRIAESHQQLTRSSRHDPLTHLLNRRGLDQSAKILFQMLARYKDKATVMFGDLDNFKAVNDTLGHSEGDVVLQRTADIMRDSLRQSDLICRYGGDEFALVLPHASGEDAKRIAERIRQQVVKLAEQTQVDFDISFGAVEASPESESFNQLLKHVDAAMYQAKSHNRQSREQRGTSVETTINHSATAET